MRPRPGDSARSNNDVELEQYQKHHETPDSDDDEDNENHEVLNDDPQLRRASIQSFELYTPDEEKAVVRKLDIYVVAFMSFLYLLSFLDRTSISSGTLKWHEYANALDRYWQCSNSRNAGRPQAARHTIRVATLSFLYHLYKVEFVMTFDLHFSCLIRFYCSFTWLLML